MIPDYPECKKDKRFLKMIDSDRIFTRLRWYAQHDWYHIMVLTHRAYMKHCGKEPLLMPDYGSTDAHYDWADSVEYEYIFRILQLYSERDWYHLMLLGLKGFNKMFPGDPLFNYLKKNNKKICSCDEVVEHLKKNENHASSFFFFL
jgi:hypothetical protein